MARYTVQTTIVFNTEVNLPTIHQKGSLEQVMGVLDFLVGLSNAAENAEATNIWAEVKCSPREYAGQD